MNWSKNIARHDVVYLSPPDDPMQGLPVGNGTLGALLWTEKDKLVISLNHSELWDEAPQAAFVKKERGETREQVQTTNRHAGRLTVDFGQPLFDCWYLQDCRGGLQLGDATANLSVQTPFARSSISAYASQDHQVFVLKGHASSEEAIERKLTLERWGSRTFARWYDHVCRDPSIGLDGTSSHAEDRRIFLLQEMRSGHFCVGAALVTEESPEPQASRLHGRSAEWKVGFAKEFSWTIYVAVAVSGDQNAGEASEACREVSRILDHAVETGETAIRRRHSERWERFWSASGVEFSNDYLENLWYLHFYFLASCSQGKNPPHFINGLWGWNRDIRPWNDYFHWNMQTLYWPVDAANHGGLARPYREYRYRQLPFAMRDAAMHFKKPGAFYADVSEKRGYQDREVFHNLTPGSQIALEFWRQYQFDGDNAFLKERGYPVMREASRFFAAMVIREEDGLYHMASAAAYEGWILIRDGITDLANGSALLTATIEAAKILNCDRREAASWGEILDHLATLPTRPIPRDWTNEEGGHRHFREGVAKGEKILHPEMLAIGSRVEDNEIVSSRLASGAVYDGIFPEAEYAPIFPAELLGLKQRATPLFEAAVNCVRMHVHQAPGWVPGPVVLARLGLAEDLAKLLAEWPSRFQFHSQGFGQWIEFMRADAEQRWRLNGVKDVDSSEEPGKMTVFPMESWPTRHMALESSGVLAAGINEMLLQSHEGFIRLFPAVLPDTDAAFTLLARGGFLVSARRLVGRVQWFLIESRLGKIATIENPWPDIGSLYIWTKDLGGEFEPNPSLVISMESGQDHISLETRSGQAYFVSSEPVVRWTEIFTPVEVIKNCEPKKLGIAVLGKERQF